MKYKNFIKNIAILLCLLVISIPIAIAEEFNRVYDANGNLISDGKYYREYNGLNQLVRVRLGNTSTSPVLEEYKWHPIEERIVVKRVFNNGVYNYTVYYPNENIVVIVNSSGTFYEKYIYQEGTLVAQVNTDGQKQVIHSDHEGSNTLITASDGSVVENTLYSPYGEILEGGKSSRYGYEGKEYDSLTDDIDFKFRKFDPKIPIYGQPDTLIENVYDPQSLNRYMFERGNPMKYTDPTGHGIIGWIIKIWDKIPNKYKPFGRGVVIGEAVTKLKEEQKKKYKETVPEEEQSEFAEDLDTFVTLGGDTGDVIQGGRVIQARTSHVYRRLTYKALDNILDIGMITEGLLGGYYWYKSSTYNAKAKSIQSEYYNYRAYFSDEADESSGNKNRERRSGGGGGGGCRCGPWGDLREEAENAAPGDTAADIIKRWREKQ